MAEYKAFPIRLLYTLVFLLPIWTHAQEPTSLSKAERALLGIVLSDTTSQTVCYLPDGYRFGMINQPDDNFILLKSGSACHLVRDGSAKVFDIVKGAMGPELRRMDGVEHVGGSYNSMAFMRKGRIHAYGGYGMWRTIDYFTVFDPAARDWKPLRTINTLRNEHCFHIYDAAADRFHVMGSHFSENHISQESRRSVDSAYAFDFKDSTWKTLGRVVPINWKGMDKIWIMNDPTVVTPFGLVEFNFGEIDLLDIPGNAVYRSRDPFYRSYHRIRESFSANLSYHSVILHLRDTAFFLFGTADSIAVEKIRLTRTDFQPEPLRTVYEPLPTGMAGRFGNSSTMLPMTLGALSLALLVLAARRMRRNRSGRSPEAESVNNRTGRDGSVSETSIESRPIDPARFLDTLNVGERDMLKQLLESARKGETMDIESMNKILGVARKDEAVQKTRRSMAVSKINEAFVIGLRGEGPLVERVRDENDKRKYRYGIDVRHVATLSRVFEGN